MDMFKFYPLTWREYCIRIHQKKARLTNSREMNKDEMRASAAELIRIEAALDSGPSPFGPDAQAFRVILKERQQKLSDEAFKLGPMGILELKACESCTGDNVLLVAIHSIVMHRGWKPRSSEAKWPLYLPVSWAFFEDMRYESRTGETLEMGVVFQNGFAIKNEIANVLFSRSSWGLNIRHGHTLDVKAFVEKDKAELKMGEYLKQLVESYLVNSPQTLAGAVHHPSVDQFSELSGKVAKLESIFKHLHPEMFEEAKEKRGE